MGNKIARIVLGIVILCAIAVGAYFILPGSIHYPIKAWLQSNFNDNYADLVEPLQKATIPKKSKVAFGDAMENMTEDSAWTIEEYTVDDKGDGTYFVYCDGYKCTVSIENETNDDSMVTHTNAHVRVVFRVDKKGKTLTIGKSEVVEGKDAMPDSIIIDDQYTYAPTDQSTYFQKTLDFLAGK